MNSGLFTPRDERTPPAWTVSALCLALADAIDARFNPVTVRGEITGFSRAASGHCYFSLKDEGGQLRCAMFRRAAVQLDFLPRDGEAVEVRGRLGVYGARGDLQLVVEHLQRAGQGALFEQFLRLKARLESEGLFDAARKRSLPALPRGIGVVTSPAAAAWQDVITALQRRAPHVPVYFAPAQVQGAGAAATLVQALHQLYALAAAGPGGPAIDVILLVRGGGAMEDLWSFNDETLVRTLHQSPVPVVTGVGHETDFTLADFVADVRAPTPTAAAELAATAREELDQELDALGQRLHVGTHRQLERQARRVEGLHARWGRPLGRVSEERAWLQAREQAMQRALLETLQSGRHRLERLQDQTRWALQRHLQHTQQGLQRWAFQLAALDPSRVLERGYAWISDESGVPLVRAHQLQPGQAVRAQFSDAAVDLQVLGPQAEAKT